MKILIVEPYYGGSHRLFLEGLMGTVKAQYELLSLPARSWKQRMQLAAPWAAEEIEALPKKKRWFDCVLCSTFIDVALFRALSSTIDGWNPATRYCTYFHENQFAYPSQFTDRGIWQFCYLNFTSALASDSIAFNSAYNRSTFLTGCRKYLSQSKLSNAERTLEQIAQKSEVLYPGVFFDDDSEDTRREGAPVIVWNHRWEHDKGPEEFFSTLYKLDRQGVNFNLMILGQSFNRVPDCFSRAKDRLSSKIIHFGYAKSRKHYLTLLKKGDIVVSTAKHEFFGIAVLEAIRAGCRPLLPERLSYPELMPKEFLYKEGALTEQLGLLCRTGERLQQSTAKTLTDRYRWSCLGHRYRRWLRGEGDIDKNCV